MSDYTPSLDEVRKAWIEYQTEVSYDSAYIPMSADEARARFKRMIEAVRAEEREKALVEGFRAGVDYIDNDPSPSWGGSIVAGRNEAARREAVYTARIREQGKEQGS